MNQPGADVSKEQFEELARLVGVADFDLMLVGDGSGSKFYTPCGWSCASYNRRTGRVGEHFGGASGGTSNMAELAPYVHVLWAWETARAGRGKPPTVLIVSDSELTVRCGQGDYRRNANLALWASIDWFVAAGYQLLWRHVPRNSNPLSKRADKVAGQTRKRLTPDCPGV